MNIEIPFTKESFYTTNIAKQNLAKIEKNIKPKYGAIISNVSKLTGVPEPLIYSFIFIESAGINESKTPYAAGLMQLSRASASDAIIFEKIHGRLEKGEIDLLKKYLGAERWAKVEKAKGSIGTFITNEDLFKSEFNILVGSLLLGQLLNQFSENGVPRLDKVVVVYNRGAYDKVSKKIAKIKGGTADDLMAQVPSGAADYIKKLGGENGLLMGLA